MYTYSVLIFILLNICCYSSPVPFVEQNPSTTNVQDEQQTLIKPSKNDEQLYYYRILCALYVDCYTNGNEQQDTIYTDLKPKRLTSSLFHGIPKFGKRAYVSAFSGIPKFG